MKGLLNCLACRHDLQQHEEYDFCIAPGCDCAERYGAQLQANIDAFRARPSDEEFEMPIYECKVPGCNFSDSSYQVLGGHMQKVHKGHVSSTDAAPKGPIVPKSVKLTKGGKVARTHVPFPPEVTAAMQAAVDREGAPSLVEWIIAACATQCGMKRVAVTKVVAYAWKPQ